MAKPGTYNFGQYVAGDTVTSKRFTITQGETPVAVDLTGATIKIDFVYKKNRVSKTIGSGITIVDASDGIFDLDAFSLSVSGIWNYDVQITLADTTIHTWVSGTIEVLDDVTI